jgi:hypothetical protein
MSSLILAKSWQHLCRSLQGTCLAATDGTESAKPDIITYTSARVFSSSPPTPSRRKWFSVCCNRHPICRYKATGNPNLMLWYLTMVILALIQESRAQECTKRGTLVDGIGRFVRGDERRNLRPNEYPYNYVLELCRGLLGPTQERSKRFRLPTYNDFRQIRAGGPDSFTYAFGSSSNTCCPKASRPRVTYAF